MSLTKLRKIISQDEETSGLQITDKDLALVYDYLQKKNTLNALGQRLVLKKEPFLHTILVSTSETHKLEFQKKLAQYNFFFNEVLNFNDVSLSRFELNEPEKKKLVQNFKSKLLNLDQLKKGFYLYGPLESGKTFFLKVIAKILMDQQKMFIFVLMADLMRKFKTNSWYSDFLEAKLNQLKNIPYLFLDDLGSEKITSSFRDDILFPLLNYRFENKKPVFISSNMNLSALVKYFEFEPEFNVDVKALKIVNRIKNLTEFYNLQQKYEF